MVDTRFDHVTVRNNWANAETTEVKGCGKLERDSPGLLKNFCDCGSCQLINNKKRCLNKRKGDGFIKKTVKIESMVKYSF